ncbi:response regulator [Radiobacillus sp. PE A8.2]|uniref:response regulator transcription factor n=1 Tax=Radiobacillus sp. PE A8.2 TaxID=3380349 RepID=UPI00388F299C
MDHNHYVVFVVEDETMILNNIVKKIEQMDMGFKVEGTAKNGQQALDLLQMKLPDVIITDIQMPQINGLQLLQQLNNNYPSVRSIIISGFNEFNYARQAIHFNAKDYLLKPIEPNALKQSLLKLRIELDAERDSVIEKLKVFKAANGECIEDTIEKFRMFLDNNYTSYLKLGEIAQELNFNSSHLSKWFVKIVGKTPSAYIIHLRMSKAKHLLQSFQEISVKEVGELVGYTDQNYFSRVFKQQEGISPAHYREKYQAKSS